MKTEPNPKVSVVLTAFRRRDNLQTQIDAVRGQTQGVHEILVWENGPDSQSGLIVTGADLIGTSSTNLGVWARFIFSLNATGDFLWILDDDTIPGPGWLKNALDTFGTHNGVIGSRGLRFRSAESYLLYDEFGPNRPNETVEEVDLLGHNWVFPTSWLSYFFSEFDGRFRSPLAGEDLHLSHSILKHLGLRCYVPPHPPGDKTIWGELEDLSLYSGRDEAGISSDPKSLVKFEKAFRHYVHQGFIPICGSHAGLSEKLMGKMVSRAPALSSRLAGTLKIRKKRLDFD